MKRWVLSASIAVWAIGCTSSGSIPAVRSEYWKDENYAAYERYAWLLSDAHRRESTQAEDHRLHDMIRVAIDERLGSMGYGQASRADADFLVTYHCKIAEKLKVEVIDQVWYGVGDGEEAQAVVPRLEMSTFDEGSIIIDFTNREGSRRVWRGVGQGRVSPSATHDQLGVIVDQSVRGILAEFEKIK